MKPIPLLMLVALAGCNAATNDTADHTYVTCGASWAANGVNVTKCESACQDYITPGSSSDTCAGTKWNHILDVPNTMPDGISGCVGVSTIDGLRGCCLDTTTEIDFVVCDVGM